MGPKGRARKRPRFGLDQVRTRNGVKACHFYMRMQGSDPGKIIIALSGPFQNVQGDWMLWITYQESPDHAEMVACADLGVCSYSSGLWHQSNWLRPLQRNVLFPESSAALLIWLAREEDSNNIPHN